MPFEALLDGTRVWPDDTDTQDNIVCPNCGGGMHIKKSHCRGDGVFVPRHFAHNPDDSCSGGESEQHKIMKWVLAQYFEHRYDCEGVYNEREISDTNRRADVVCLFEQAHHRYGKGIIGEVQWRNESKDIDQCTKDYLNAGYSVCWVGSNEFTDNWKINPELDITTPWPNTVPNESEWQQTQNWLTEYRQNSTTPKMEIPLPSEMKKSLKDKLKMRWELGNGNYNPDLIRELTDHNAPRTCAKCGDSADVYVFDETPDPTLSKFYCEKDIPTKSGAI